MTTVHRHRSGRNIFSDPKILSVIVFYTSSCFTSVAHWYQPPMPQNTFAKKSARKGCIRKQDQPYNYCVWCVFYSCHCFHLSSRFLQPNEGGLSAKLMLTLVKCSSSTHWYDVRTHNPPHNVSCLLPFTSRRTSRTGWLISVHRRRLRRCSKSTYAHVVGEIINEKKNKKKYNITKATQQQQCKNEICWRTHKRSRRRMRKKSSEMCGCR